MFFLELLPHEFILTIRGTTFVFRNSELGQELVQVLRCIEETSQVRRCLPVPGHISHLIGSPSLR